MSWQAYVDTNLVGTGKVAKAAIFGLNGAQWATTPGFQVQSSEMSEIIAAFADNTTVQANGVHVAGVKYFTLRADDRSIYGKQKADGVCLVKTLQAVIVGVYVEGMQAGSCTTVVEGLADYLISVGF
ncbi:profilin, required for normal timing of actin polymerization in response to thermal stress [Apophysomyces sp. BC1034]|nr:profilin, required for normal timing of actin polymerization in response to thermal stress [Apophysomyces sp. BC1015]KAG0183597.1 profilin, required for normal timing of actin polymerization in response to thermal stress [Apophysomyces sp. BC1021]KAG0183623.1 profilin, required for normal timing of actin polymerization in response to thermal stress [Apophysomyces sp. BC1021]KAG0194881.1 profilin, required for normal timing of actin polymerization in response to thermal stress [Apophysomyces s